MILDIRGNIQDYLDALAEDDEFLSAFDRVNAAVEFGQRRPWTTRDVAFLRRAILKFVAVRGCLDVKAWCSFAHYRYGHAPDHRATAEVLSMLNIYHYQEGDNYGNAI